jgi:hypothetical protein
MHRTITELILLDLLLIYGGTLQLVTQRGNLGRHRAVGLSTMQDNVARAKAATRQVAADVMGAWWLADESGDFTTPGPGGAGRYAHLRSDELDATAERALVLAARGIRAPSPWGTPVLDDVWADELVGAA